MISFSIIKDLLSSKLVIYCLAAAACFLAGYQFAQMRAEVKEAKVIVKEVIRFVEKENKVRARYKKLDLTDKATKERILSGKMSEHYEAND